MIQYGVAVLEKAAIPCGLRLVLDHLGSSESINMTVLDHQSMSDGKAEAGAALSAPV